MIDCFTRKEEVETTKQKGKKKEKTPHCLSPRNM
jgi:hypothetical protein